MPLEYVTFNSLSRDHDDPRYITVRGDEILSTPSLGITPRSRLQGHRLGRRLFQLPLSGSHILICSDADLTMILSTPSLGITSDDNSFTNSDADADYFQLPLSGSPSPIPGFFGSPRLSAAAPLRTNDF